MPSLSCFYVQLLQVRRLLIIKTRLWVHFVSHSEQNIDTLLLKYFLRLRYAMLNLLVILHRAPSSVDTDAAGPVSYGRPRKPSARCKMADGFGL